MHKQARLCLTTSFQKPNKTNTAYHDKKSKKKSKFSMPMATYLSPNKIWKSNSLSSESLFQRHIDNSMTKPLDDPSRRQESINSMSRLEKRVIERLFFASVDSKTSNKYAVTSGWPYISEFHIAVRMNFSFFVLFCA